MHYAGIRRIDVQTTQLGANVVVVGGERAGVVLAYRINIRALENVGEGPGPRASLHSCTRKRVDWLHLCARQRLFSLLLALIVDAGYSRFSPTRRSRWITAGAVHKRAFRRREAHVCLQPLWLWALLLRPPLFPHVVIVPPGLPPPPTLHMAWCARRLPLPNATRWFLVCAVGSIAHCDRVRTRKPRADGLNRTIITTPNLEENRRVSHFLRSVEISRCLSVANVWLIVLKKKLWFLRDSLVLSKVIFFPFVNFCARSCIVIAHAVNLILNLWTASVVFSPPRVIVGQKINCLFSFVRFLWRRQRSTLECDYPDDFGHLSIHIFLILLFICLYGIWSIRRSTLQTLQTSPVNSRGIWTTHSGAPPTTCESTVMITSSGTTEESASS